MSNNLDIIERSIYFTGNITEESGHKIIIELSKIEDEDNKNENMKDFQREPIYFHINSLGGEAYSCFAIVSKIQSMSTPVFTICSGFAMSAGLTIFASGIKRYVSPYSMLMYHGGSWNSEGFTSQMRASADHLSSLDDITRRIVFKHIEENEYLHLFVKSENSNVDFYFDGNQALKYGIATDLIELKKWEINEGEED